MAIEIVSFPTKNGVVYSLLLNYTGVGRRIPRLANEPYGALNGLANVPILQKNHL